MKKIMVAFSLLCSSLWAIAQPSFIKDSLDKYINEGMKYYSIPGLSIAVIKDGKTVVMKGYGVTDITTNQAVDENTLFMVASNSKLFTGTALALLDYHKKINLNDKITKHFPWFKLYDDKTTALVTIKDMLTHRLGTKTFQGDFTFWDSKLSPKEIMYKMRYLKPSQEFRSSYGYCNSCFLTAGEVIPKVTNGTSWAQFVYDSMVKPLNMSNTYTLGEGMANMSNAAKPYTNAFTGTLLQLPYDNIDNFAPAASIVSNVKDMAKWLQMQLDSGKYNGTQILPWPVLAKTREMVNMVSSQKRGNTHFTGYGLGVFSSDYLGYQLYNHTGGAGGFVTNTCFIPELKLGICILTNNDNQSFFEMLRMQIIDAYCNAPYVNKSMANLPKHIESNQQAVNKIFAYQQRVKNQQPTLKLAAYTGEYFNELYGKITITQQENNLMVHFTGHDNLLGKMEYMDNDEWLISYNNPLFGIFPIKFKIADKKVKSVDIKVADFIEYDPYTFIKKENKK